MFRKTLLLVACCLSFANAAGAELGWRWSPEQGKAWQAKTGWLVGCNFGPSTAINQLEMWQAESFDMMTIDRELGYAESLGFTSLRVFLHDLPYRQDAKGFLKRIDKFLGAAEKHHIGIVFVLLDSCWDPHPKLGKQHDPKPHVHNSGWVQSPGLEVLMDLNRHDELKPYVTGVIGRFRKDPRVHAWDLFNEPDNTNGSSYGRFESVGKPDCALHLLKKAFIWARSVKPTQPLTAGVWLGDWGKPEKLSPMEKLCLDQSDVISFHCYGKPEELQRCIQNLRRYERPILCTEYMARPNGSTFDPHLGLMRDQGVGAFNWGFVSGKTQTIYPWDSWSHSYTNEPPVWFHDIFRGDGTPYREEEVTYIRRVTGKAAGK